MKEKLVDFYYYLSDKLYNVKFRVQQISDKSINILTIVGVVLWLGVCSLVTFSALSNKQEEVITPVALITDIYSQTMTTVYDLERKERESEAFEYLATQLNRFNDSYTEEEIMKMNNKLSSLANEAEPMDIETLYFMSDLTEQQPIYEFTGIVTSVEEDPMYGTFSMVSANETQSLEQLEVSGLVDVVEGTQVTFVGVPNFIDVASPIKVEAFVLPIEEENTDE